MSSKSTVQQPFRPPRNADTGTIEQRWTTVGGIDHRSHATESTGHTRPVVVSRPPGCHQLTATNTTTGAAGGSSGVGKPAENPSSSLSGVSSLGRNVFGAVMGSHSTATSGAGGVSGVVKPAENPSRSTSGVVPGKPVSSLGRSSSGAVPGSHCSASSGALRQIQLTDCASLPARVQQQLYLCE